jgi:O-antigen/teichoic acid export membrane protein
MDTKEHDALAQLLNGAKITFFLSVLGYLLVFLLKLGINRVFGPAEYAYLQFVLTILGFAGVISSVGVGSLLVTYIPQYLVTKNYSSLKGLTRFAYLLPFMLSLLFSAILIGAAPYIVEFFGKESILIDFLTLAAFYLPLRVILDVTATRFLAFAHPFFTSFAAQVIDRLVMGSMLVYAYLNDKPVVWLVYALGISYVVQLIWYLLAHNYVAAPTKKYTIARYTPKLWLVFCMPLLFTGLVGFVFEWTDYFTVAKYFSAETLGIYDLTYSVAAYLLIIPALLSTLFIPVLTQSYIKDKERFRHIFARLQRFALIVTAGIAAIFMIFAPELLLVLFGPNFVPGAHMLLLLCACFVISSIFMYYQCVLLIEKKSKLLFGFAIMFGIADLICNIAAAKFAGSITLIALSTGVFLILTKLCEYIAARKYVRISFPFFDLARVVLCALITAAFCRLVFAALSRTSDTPLSLLIVGAACIGLLVYLALLRVMHLLSTDEVQLLFSLHSQTSKEIQQLKHTTDAAKAKHHAQHSRHRHGHHQVINTDISRRFHRHH